MTLNALHMETGVHRLVSKDNGRFQTQNAVNRCFLHLEIFIQRSGLQPVRFYQVIDDGGSISAYSTFGRIMTEWHDQQWCFSAGFRNQLASFHFSYSVIRHFHAGMQSDARPARWTFSASFALDNTMPSPLAPTQSERVM